MSATVLAWKVKAAYEAQGFTVLKTGQSGSHSYAIFDPQGKFTPKVVFLGGLESECHYLNVKKTCLVAGADWSGPSGMKAALNLRG